MHRIHTRWRRNYLTIDMFKFTDVTASHVFVFVFIACLKTTLRTSRHMKDMKEQIGEQTKCCRVVFLNIIELSVTFVRRVHECFALLYERLRSFSFHLLCFWPSLFRSCIFQYSELVLHFPFVHFDPVFYLVLLIPVPHFQSTHFKIN